MTGDGMGNKEGLRPKESKSFTSFFGEISKKKMPEMSTAENTSLRNTHLEVIKKIAPEINYKSLIELVIDGVIAWPQVMTTLIKASSPAANELGDFFNQKPNISRDYLSNLVYNLARLISTETTRVVSRDTKQFGVSDLSADTSRVTFSGMGVSGDFSKEQLRWGLKLAFRNSSGSFQLPYVRVDKKDGHYLETIVFVLSEEELKLVEKQLGSTTIRERAVQTPSNPELEKHASALTAATAELEQAVGQASTYEELLGLFGGQPGKELSAVQDALFALYSYLIKPENDHILMAQRGYRVALLKSGLLQDEKVEQQSSRARAWLEYRMNEKFSMVGVGLGSGSTHDFSDLLVLELRTLPSRGGGLELAAVGNAEGSLFRDRIAAAKALVYKNGERASAHFDPGNLAILEALDAALVPGELGRTARRRGAEVVLNKEDHARYVRLMDLKDEVARFNRHASSHLNSINRELQRHPLPQDDQVSKLREDEITSILSPIQSAIELDKILDRSGNTIIQIRLVSAQEDTKPS